MRENIGVHDIHSDKCAKARLAWSKNVTEERAAPWQHLFGCMDYVFCAILNVGLWLEVLHSQHGVQDTPFMFPFSDLSRTDCDNRNAD
eukprot:scaffold35394_cov389-Amphora_coffeaeformis.AAC.1